jgi:tyrosine-protein phosphatase YwqE
MESIGWHASEFGITYRTLVDVLEQMCEGTLICIEQEEPYQFSGLGFVNNLDEARDVLFEFCQKEIKKLIAENEDYREDKLSDDEREAAEFFKAIA